MTVLAAQHRQSGTDNLAGLVERVTFHNPDNGFCVLRVKARGQRDLVTVVGHAALIAAGEFVQAAGTWTNDREHGLQFRASFLKASRPRRWRASRSTSAPARSAASARPMPSD